MFAVKRMVLEMMIKTRSTEGLFISNMFIGNLNNDTSGLMVQAFEGSI